MDKFLLLATNQLIAKATALLECKLKGVGNVRNVESNLRNEKCGMLMRNGGLNAECGTQFILLSF